MSSPDTHLYMPRRHDIFDTVLVSAWFSTEPISHIARRLNCSAEMIRKRWSRLKQSHILPEQKRNQVVRRNGRCFGTADELELQERRLNKGRMATAQLLERLRH